MVAFMNTLSSVVLATLLSLMLFATQGVNASALTDTLTGKMNTPATNSTKNISTEAQINQAILSTNSQPACQNSTLINLWVCTKEMCDCTQGTFDTVKSCLQTLASNGEISNTSGNALITQYGVTCAAQGSTLTGFNGASRASSFTALTGGVVLAAVLSVVL